MTTRELTLGDFVAFMNDARKEDLYEVYAMHGKKIEDFVLSSFQGVECVYEGDKIFGIGGIDDDYIWLLCTHEVERQPVKFLRGIKQILKLKIKDNKILRNYAWLGNPLHIKWLKWMGARFNDKIYRNENTHEDFLYFEFKGE